MWTMPLCSVCQHFHKSKPDGQAGDPHTCAAYPQGIPRRIYPEGFDHRLPFKGDHGIRFELKEGEELPPGYA